MEHISDITANFPEMFLLLDQFLWGHSSHDCDISCYNLKGPKAPSKNCNKKSLMVIKINIVVLYLDFLAGQELI